jgi:DNA-binding transcriptional LysR family regulator
MLMYDVRRLRSLCAIADHGSLTGAADALDFTQPAVSQHLAALEAEVGATLVRRSRGGAELTAAGALLVEHARAALDRLALAELQVADLIAREQRRVRLAANSSALTRLVPHAVADLRRRLPDAEVTITECGPPKALAKLRKGDIDLAVTFRRAGADGPADVEERTLLEEPMYAVVPRTHPLAGEESIELAGLRDDGWVQGPLATSPGLIRELCREAGFEPEIAFESDDPLATRGIVAAGLAVSIVPSLTRDDTARDRNVVVLPLRDPPRRRVVAATAAGGRPTQATLEMVESLARAGARIGRATV